MEHIRQGWQLCRIWDGTHGKRHKSKNVQHHKYLTYMPDALTFWSFYFNWECNLIYSAENFVMLLVWWHTMHTLSYFSKQMLVIG
jgi:hypothetical protein